MMEKFYKLVYDITCYYVFASFFFYWAFQIHTDTNAYGILLLAILLHVFSERFGKIGSVVNGIAILLPAVWVFREQEALARMQLILPWIYFVYVVIKEQYGLYYDDFKSRFKGMLIALLAPLVLFGLTDDIEIGKTAMTEMVPYLIIFFVSGILLMQNLRFRAGTKSRETFEKHQLKQTVVFFVFCILLTMGRLLEILSELIIFPLLRTILGGIVALLYIIADKMPKRHTEFNDLKNEFAKYYEQTQYGKEELERAAWAESWGEYMAKNAEPEATPDYTMAFVVVALVLAVILFIVLVGGTKAKVKDAMIEDEREELDEVEPPVKKLKKHSIHPELVVRYYYLKFMESANSEKAKVMRSDTTEEIRKKFLLKKSDKAAETKELTELYQKVRYTKKNVTREDASKMKSLMKKVSA